MIPQYSLDLFRLLIKQKPAGFPISETIEAEKECERLEKEAQTPEQVDSSIREFGKKVWPYLQAQNYFLEHYGEKKRREYFLQFLPEDLAQKWEQFEKAGGSVHHFRNAEEYEKYFTSEEDQKIEAAMVESNEKTKEFVRDLAQGDKREEYNNLIANFQKEKEEIDILIENLRELKKRSLKFAEEIDGDIVYIQNGFAEMEERPTVSKTKERVEWYKGQIEGLS